MPSPLCTCTRTRIAGLIAATTALSMFGAFAAETLAEPAQASYSIVDTAAVTSGSDTVGISDNNLYFDADDPAAITKQLDEMQALGVQNVRIAVPWAAIETADGTYDWSAIDAMVDAAQARGMGILAVVNTTPTWARAAGTSVYAPPTNVADFAGFLTTMATRYAGEVGDYEVWNEPNSAQSYAPAPDPAGYTALLRAAYPAIKAADPTATVIAGVLGSTPTYAGYTLDPVTFIQEMYADGAASYFDALSFHPYQYSTEFSQGANLTDSPLDQVTDIYNLMVANGDGSKKIWATEYGLPTSVVGDAQQATYISDFLDSWSQLSYAGPAFLYTLVDSNSSDTTNPESTFGVYTDAWVEKPAAEVIAAFIAAHPQDTAAEAAAALAAAQQAAEQAAAQAQAQAAAQAVAAGFAAAIQAYFQSLANAIQAAFAAMAAAPAAPTPTAVAAAETSPTTVAASTATTALTTDAAPPNTSTTAARTTQAVTTPSTSSTTAPTGTGTSTSASAASTTESTTQATTSRAATAAPTATGGATTPAGSGTTATAASTPAASTAAPTTTPSTASTTTTASTTATQSVTSAPSIAKVTSGS